MMFFCSKYFLESEEKSLTAQLENEKKKLAMKILCIFLLIQLYIFHSLGNVVDFEKIGATLSSFERHLNSTHSNLVKRLEEAPRECTYYTSECFEESKNGVWPGNLGRLPLQSDPTFQDLKINYDHSVTKLLPGLQSSPHIVHEVCAMVDLPEWKVGRDDASLKGVSWQYAATSDGISSFYPASDWSSNCNYDPRIRPWYVSAVAAQRNIAIMIDMSEQSAFNIELIRSTAISILAAVSYWDFFCVVTYTDSATECVMQRGLPENVESAQALVRGIEAEPQTSAHVGKVLRSTMKGMEASVEAGDTSYCTSVLMLLSSGGNHKSDPTPLHSIQDAPLALGNVILFAGIFSHAMGDGAIYGISKASCHTRGVVKRIDSASQYMQMVNDYFSVKISNDAIRWSYPYVDALGQGIMITGSKAIYEPNSGDVEQEGEGEGEKDGTSVRAIVSIDLVLDQIFTNQSSTSVANALLEYQKCPIPDKKVRGPGELETCDLGIGDADSGHSDAEKLEPAIIFSHVALIIGSIVPPVVIQDPFTRIATMAVLAVSGIVNFFTLWLSELPRELRQNTIWEQTTLTYETFSANPFRCCDKTHCTCSNTNPMTPSCGFLIRQLMEGECNDGYHCCEEECYTICSGGKYGSCSTYCECERRVLNQRCRSTCGTCHRPEITVSFQDTGGERHLTKISEFCGRDNFACLEQYRDSHKINTSKTGWYNPFNKNEVDHDISYGWYLYLFIVFCIPTGVSSLCGLFIIARYLFLRVRARDARGTSVVHATSYPHSYV